MSETTPGKRLVSEALLTMARKNGKTELVAGLVIAHLGGPVAEKNGQVYSTAADRNQAALIFNAAAAMIRADPELAAEFNIIDSAKRITHPRTGSFYQALSSESKTKHGFNPSFVVNDELAQAPNRKLYDTLKTAMGARLTPLMFTISTMSDDPNSIMSELVEYGERVNKGEVDDPTFKAFIYETPEDYDLLDEEGWMLANPALGDFRSLEEFRSLAIRAKRTPTFEPTFRLLYLNQRVAAGEAYVARTDWAKCGAAPDPAYLEKLKRRAHDQRCYAALDLSAVKDLTALELLFEPLTSDDKWVLLTFAWLPDDELEDRAEHDRVPYVVWRDKGILETCPGRVIDPEMIADRIGEIHQEWRIDKLVFDRWRFESLKLQLDKQGVDVECVPYGQGFKDMAVALDAMEREILDENMLHGSNPILTWCITNVRVDKDPAGNRKFTKKKSKGRIDAAQAAAMAFGQFEKEATDEKAVGNYGDLVAVG